MFSIIPADGFDSLCGLMKESNNDLSYLNDRDGHELLGNFFLSSYCVSPLDSAPLSLVLEFSSLLFAASK